MFRALCERSSEQGDIRRPVMLGDVAAVAEVSVEAVKPIVNAFRDARRNFLIPPLSIPLDAETTLDISHESLIRQWQTLNAWVVAETESARRYRYLEDAAKRRQQRTGGNLWHGIDLENARVWKEREKPTEAWASCYGDAYQLAMDFLKESEAEEEEQRREIELAHLRDLEQAARAAEQARSASRFKVITVAISVLLVVTIGVSIYALTLRNIAASAKEQVQGAELAALEVKLQRRVDLALLALLARQVPAKDEQLRRLIKASGALDAAVTAEDIGALREAVRKNTSKTLAGHTEAVYSVAFSPDGQTDLPPFVGQATPHNPLKALTL